MSPDNGGGRGPGSGNYDRTQSHPDTVERWILARLAQINGWNEDERDAPYTATQSGLAIDTRTLSWDGPSRPILYGAGLGAVLGAAIFLLFGQRGVVELLVVSTFAMIGRESWL